MTSSMCGGNMWTPIPGRPRGRAGGDAAAHPTTGQLPAALRMTSPLALAPVRTLRGDMLALLIASLAVASVTGQTAGHVERDSGVDAAAFPIVSYNSDIGLGFGAVAGAYIYGPGFRPYRHGI